jgi:hypothetical protein
MVLLTAMALAAGCGDDQAIVGGSCAAGYTQCGTRCVDLETDPQDCGVCGRACPSGLACIGGVCGTSPSDGAGGEAGDATTADAVGDGTPRDQTPGDVHENGEGGNADVTDGNRPDVNSGDGGDACPPPPYDTAQHCGDCATVCSGTNDTCVPVDGGFACVPLCAPPLVECTSQCVDVTTNELNCGHCGTVCVSQICRNSLCVGSTSGGIVFIGHDYQTTPAGTSQARVLSNAVFIPQTNPLNVMSYERYSNAAAVTRIKTILNGVAQQRGGTLNFTSTTNDADIPAKLAFQTYGVLLVPDQVNAPTGALAVLGASWASTLASFTQVGGVVVVLDGATGVGEMPAFSTATGLLGVSAHASIAAGTPLDLLAPADVVGAGVVSPYAANNSSASITTEPNGGSVIYVVQLPADAGTGAPVVVHKVL